ncbi:ribosomal S5 domain 2 [Pyrrhoderma noxium]|uniref:Ribosomal RNA-processing protein 43 n=1 Tax=Pyrrhoderma noxium TaxID=2282107 RepID=A0A286UPA6_9AGAM|nr:ribosomal S5 domain 2 [Pyrrhoderma noxium]
MSTLASSSTSSSSNAQDIELQAETFRRLHPRAYLERFLSEGFRPDGREIADWRDVSVNVGSISTADGSSLVRLGDTTIVCGVKAEIAEPDLDTPNSGFLVPNLDLPAICSPKFKPGPPVDEAQVLSERLYDALISTDTVPLSSLCIQPGRAAWVLYVDATCINYDGNVFDAALLAMTAALKNTRLPKARYDVDLAQTLCTRKEKIPLQLNRTPLAYSFGIYDSTNILSDPTSFEEPLLDATLSIIVDENGDLLSILQSGPNSNGVEKTISHCISSAKQRRKDLKEIMNVVQL